MIIILLSFLISFISSKEIPNFNLGGLEDTVGLAKEHVPKKVRGFLHQDVKLDCLRPDMEELSSDTVYSWVFYPSSQNGGAGKDPVSYILCGGSDLPPCNRKLIVEKVNSSSSGLYKCSVLTEKESGHVMTSKPIVTYQLDVKADHEPKFLEGPQMVNVYEDTTATLICKVQSEIPIIIKWFKRDNYPKLNVTVIHYNNNTYRPLKNVKEYAEGNTYVSELVFSKVFKNDSGIYACSFVSPTGQIIYKEGSISVHQTLVIFSSLVQEKWEIFAAVLVVIILVIVTVLCMVILCFKKMWEKNDDQPLNIRRKPSKSDPDGNETSEYEHVVL
ncbi:uncharacterized protein [Halyomorpha halys]|uniref:uncharacterized protein isoform X1 n=1 Tax=Halyomorpha halys TaxID=286706 RepID=UPI0006D4D146